MPILWNSAHERAMNRAECKAFYRRRRIARREAARMAESYRAVIRSPAASAGLVARALDRLINPPAIWVT